MDYKYKCKNHGARVYKCWDWAENHDACKNCELRAMDENIIKWHRTEFSFSYVLYECKECDYAKGISKDEEEEIMSWYKFCPNCERRKVEVD